jgi:6-phosphogluconolactonase
MRKLTMKAARVALGIATLGGVGIAGTVGASTANAAENPTTATANVSPVVGHVYLDDNTTGTNTIGAFNRHADGSLTPLGGSPFNAGGAGTGGGLASQGALQISSDGRYLIAADAGSSQISVLRIKPDGTLQLVGVVSSDGPTPVSIAEHNGLVYVANAGAVGPNYTGFTLNAGGQLRPLDNSTVSLPDGSQPGDVLFNSTGANLVGTRVGTSKVDSFVVGADGLLTANAASPSAAQATGPFGSEFSPTDPSKLFVSNAHAGAGQGSVSSFSVAADGTLSPVQATPVANGQSGTCWVEVSHDGKFLFSVSTGSGTLTSYSIASDGTLTVIGNTAVANQGGVGATDLRLSPDGSTLYVNESRVGKVAAFAVNGGALTELPSSPISLPGGATPAGIVVN